MRFHSTTTLAEIRAAGPCGIKPDDNRGWAKLLRNLGEPHGKPNLAREVTVLEILNSNGFDDAVWCLRAPSLERLSRHFRALCVERVLHIYEAKYPGDTRVRDQIAMLRRDDATEEEREQAAREARAARDAAYAAYAAYAAAAVAAYAAAAAARDAAYAAKSRAAERAAQEEQLRAMIAAE